MTRNELREQVAKANRLVATWPAWKQNILAHSSQPSVSSPRPPVDNQAGQSDPRAREARNSQGQ